MVASTSMLLSFRPCEKLNHNHLLFQYHRGWILPSLFPTEIRNASRWVHSNSKNKRPMVTASSSSSNSGAFTTLKERVTFAQEIKKSKFIAIAGPLFDQRAANAFLSEVIVIPTRFFLAFSFMGFFSPKLNLVSIHQVQDPKATHNCWAYKVRIFPLVLPLGWLCFI